MLNPCPRENSTILKGRQHVEHEKSGGFKGLNIDIHRGDDRTCFLGNRIMSKSLRPHTGPVPPHNHRGGLFRLERPDFSNDGCGQTNFARLSLDQIQSWNCPKHHINSFNMESTPILSSS